MKYKKLAYFISYILFMSIFTGCIDSSLPIYEKIDEDGFSVIIDGIKYKDNPPLKWDVNIRGEKIGFAGNKDISLYEVEGDKERYFIYYYYNFGDAFGRVLYRSDIEIPEPSEKTIDEIEWVEYYTKNDNNEIIIEEEYTNTIEDITIIQELFNA